jgi:hypothetical protein
MHQMKVEGFWVAKVSATRRSVSPGMPVMFSTTSGVIGFTASRIWSMP